MAVIVLAVQACSLFAMAEARAADDVSVFLVAAVRLSRERRAAGHHHGITNKIFKRDASSGCAEEENKNRFLLAETSVLSRTRSIGYPRRQAEDAAC